MRQRSVRPAAAQGHRTRRRSRTPPRPRPAALAPMTSVVMASGVLRQAGAADGQAGQRVTDRVHRRCASGAPSDPRSRKSFRRTLPTGDFGRSSRNTHDPRHFVAGQRSAGSAAATPSSVSAGILLARRTRTTISPVSSSGTPTTALSATPGCAAMTASTSFGIDVEAADENHVLLAIDDLDVAVLVHLRDVAGGEPAVAQHARRFVGTLPVALHDLRALHPQLADLAGRHVVAFRIDEPARRCRATARRWPRAWGAGTD